MKSIKIFLSSPKDVIPERLIAQRVIDRLHKKFSSYADIKSVLWEREPLVVTSTYQHLITPPSECDIVITILWSRLGTVLNSNFVGKVTAKESVTGTEWEFEEAYDKFLQDGSPDMLLYKKTMDLHVTTRDREKLQEIIYQEQLLETFMSQWLVDEDSGIYKGAFWEFETTQEFEEMLESHLYDTIVKKLNQEFKSDIRYFDGNPYRGLQSFEKEHSSLFFGRSKAINEVREAFEKQIKKASAFLIILGASGSGKSSLVKAGLLPDLLLPGMLNNVTHARYSIITPGDIHNDLIKGLATTLLSDAVLPELKELQYDVESLTAHFKKAPELAAQPIKQALDLIAKKEKLTKIAHTKLIIIIDQFEELFTFKNIDEKQREEFDFLLAILATSGYVWIVATMRSDFFTYIEKLPQLVELSKGNGQYLLTFPSEAEIGQMITKPAEKAGLRFEVDKTTGISLDEELRKTASLHSSSLPLLEYMLEQLWNKCSQTRVLSYEIYNEMGGLEGALGEKAEMVFATLSEDVQKQLPSVIRMLVSIALDDEYQKTARKVPYELFKNNDATLTLVEAFLASDVRLLLSDTDEDGNNYIRVTHEALFSHWKRAKEIIIRESKDIELRDRLEVASLHWNKIQGKDKNTFLLPSGLALLEAKDLLIRHPSELGYTLKNYIKTSSQYEKKQNRNKRRVNILILIVSVSISLLMLWLAVDANRQKNIAIKIKKQLTERNKQLSTISLHTIQVLLKTDKAILKHYINLLMNSDNKDIFLNLLKPLINKSTNMDEKEKKYWFSIYPRLTNEQVARLTTILFSEGLTLKKIQDRYDEDVQRLKAIILSKEYNKDMIFYKNYMISAKVLKKYPKLIKMMLESDSMDKIERQEWFLELASFNKLMIEKLYAIFEEEKRKLDVLNQELIEDMNNNVILPDKDVKVKLSKYSLEKLK